TSSARSLTWRTATSASIRGNSYLGGIFQLFKGDSVFVKVNNSSQVHGEAYENFFGAFMV
uniref:THD domain-containing protein n=1 Tax=Sinocyclocheilus anshuiensis TaxID=1608454 RepID=A0A671NX81_9TELE